MFGLDFLNDIKVEEVASKSAPRPARKGNLNPAADFMGIRVWKNGAVYPSKALVDAFHLEYPTKVKRTVNVEQPITNPDGTVSTQSVAKEEMVVPEGTVANGFDVFTLSSWSQIDEATRNARKLILVGISPKSASKVDLFNISKYNEDGSPKMSVMEQGAMTFGADNLLPMLADTYGVTPNEEGFIDVQLVVGINLASKVPNGIFILPKVISRGKDAGKADFVRRENISVCPLIVADNHVSAPVQTEDTVPTGRIEEPATNADYLVVPAPTAIADQA